MATRTKPLMAAASLATAAAVAVATPALAPSITNNITTPALSSAKVNLTTFADLLTIPAQGWTDAFFNGWGGAIGPINVDPAPPVNDYWIPFCNYDCTIAGISGVAYLALDALFNGDGYGYDDPGSWGVNAVNYFFEGGTATGVQYILEKPFLGEPYVTPGPLYNPAIADAIALAFQGPYLLTTVYTVALATASALISTVPVVGPTIAGGIDAYLYGVYLYTDSDGNNYYSVNGLSGLLQYVTDLFTGGVPTPPVTAAAVAATKKIASEVTNLVTAPAEAATAAVASVASVAPKRPARASVAKAASAATEAASAELTPAATDTTPAPAKPADEAATTAVTAVADTPAASAPTNASADAPAKPSRRPVRDAVASVKKAVTSAVGGAAARATGGAKSAS